MALLSHCFRKMKLIKACVLSNPLIVTINRMLVALTTEVTDTQTNIVSFPLWNMTNFETFEQVLCCTCSFRYDYHDDCCKINRKSSMFIYRTHQVVKPVFRVCSSCFVKLCWNIVIPEALLFSQFPNCPLHLLSLR